MEFLFATIDISLGLIRKRGLLQDIDSSQTLREEERSKCGKHTAKNNVVTANHASTMLTRPPLRGKHAQD